MPAASASGPRHEILRGQVTRRCSFDMTYVAGAPLTLANATGAVPGAPSTLGAEIDLKAASIVDNVAMARPVRRSVDCGQRYQLGR
jgi:hypothetical protein